MNHIEKSRLEVLTAVTIIRISVLWDVTTSSFVESNEYFGGTCFLHPQDVTILRMEVVGFSETLVTFYETTRRNIPEDRSLPAKIS
jgi:hypothetical protein